MIDQFLEPIYSFLMVLPIIAFLSLWCLTVFSMRDDWRVGFLKAALLWSAITCAIRRHRFTFLEPEISLAYAA